MVDDAIDPQDISRSQSRVGLSAIERLSWALGFAQSDPVTFTSADWARWRLELTARASRLHLEGRLSRLRRPRDLHARPHPRCTRPSGRSVLRAGGLGQE